MTISKIKRELIDFKQNNKTLDEAANEILHLANDVSDSTIRPPLGLMPKNFYDKQIKAKRFNEVWGAITRYYNAGLKIKIEWIEEYNMYILNDKIVNNSVCPNCGAEGHRTTLTI